MRETLKSILETLGTTANEHGGDNPDAASTNQSLGCRLNLCKGQNHQGRLVTSYPNLSIYVSIVTSSKDRSLYLPNDSCAALPTALTMDHRRTVLRVLLPRDPHALERRARREERAAEQRAVFGEGRRDDVDLGLGGCQRRQVLGQALGEARKARELPPASTTFAYSSAWMSASHFAIAWKICSTSPVWPDPSPRSDPAKSAFAQRKRSLPSVNGRPFGSSKVASTVDVSASAFLISAVKSRATYPYCVGTRIGRRHLQAAPLRDIRWVSEKGRCSRTELAQLGDCKRIVG